MVKIFNRSKIRPLQPCKLSLNWILSSLVHASDGNGGRTSTSLTITITDANDSPEFLKAPYTLAIDEGLTTGFTFLTASAIDDDSGDTLTYSLSGTNNADFTISSSSGVITTAKILDYETVTLYSLTVSVSDGNVAVTTSLTISVNVKMISPLLLTHPALQPLMKITQAQLFTP